MTLQSQEALLAPSGSTGGSRLHAIETQKMRDGDPQSDARRRFHNFLCKLDWETIDADQISDIMAGNEPRAPKSGILTKRTPPGDSGSGGVSPSATAPA